MRTFIIALVIQLALGGLFALGLFSQQTAFAIVAFCGWTPAAWFLGWAASRTLRINVRFMDSTYEEPQPLPRRAPAPVQDRVSRLQNVGK